MFKWQLAVISGNVVPHWEHWVIGLYQDGGDKIRLKYMFMLHIARGFVTA
jgi:hypothetical protein